LNSRNLGATPNTLDGWLAYLERLHPQAIAMGLERVERVRQALALSPRFPVITVGGTNGKGSCCAMLESILMCAGYRVGTYTSPHLLRYNERVRVAGVEASDDVLCRAFERIERVRGDISLTYFEFGTLAAMLEFVSAEIDVAILEVGLGGRLDAVNDHMEYLGTSREAIGLEKAGIFRSGVPAICADADAPATLQDRAREVGAELMLINREYGVRADTTQWQYWGPAGKRHGLPYPALRGAFQLSNAATCITALDSLRDKLPVTAQDVRSGLHVLPGRPSVILDVAHNPHAARALCANLASLPKSAKTIAVFSMLNDKDIAGVIAAVKDRVTHWHVARVESPRAASIAQLLSAMAEAGVESMPTQFEDVAGAWRAACVLAAENDKIIVFGSFLTVAAVMRERQAQSLQRK
jgi:dihydrofolate synthase / folylpolyglutamate synthase